jgi:hypothetical protein
MIKNTSFPFTVSTYSSGQAVPRSGTFRLTHKHAVVHEITLLKNHTFTGCSRCSLPVLYAFVNWLPCESASSRIRLLMHRARPALSGL